MKLLTALLLFSVALSAQIPAEYSTVRIDEITSLVNRLELDYDVVIDPIERLPTMPSAYTFQAGGNWGATWTGANKHYDEVKAAAVRPVVVFIFDTAPFFNHPALDGFAWNQEGKSYTGESTLIDGEGHGHHVAGIIGARSDKFDLGIARMLVDVEKLRGVPIEVLNDQGSGSYSVIGRAIRETNRIALNLINEGHFVIYNFSLGGPGSNTQIQQAMAEARNIGVFVVAASGNTYEGELEFPAHLEPVNAVGSIDSDGRRSSFSSYGEGLYMVAPGRGILSTYKNGKIVELSGTSMATPTQAALAAIAASVHPELNADSIRQLLINVATDISPDGYDQETGHGYDYVGKILNYSSEPGGPDVPQYVTKKSRAIRFKIPGIRQLIYQRGSGRFLDFGIDNLEIQLRTKLLASAAIEQVQIFADAYFEGRGYVLSAESDFLDAGYWAGRFFESEAKEMGLRLKVEAMDVVNDKGRIGEPKKPGLFRFLKPKPSMIKY